MIKVIILICILIMVKFLEKWERENSQRFWSVIMLLAITFSSFDEIQFQTTQTPTRIDKNIAPVLALAINYGGERSKPEFDSFVLQTGLGKRKKFNIVFHHRLEQHFPDWKGRMDYQEKQEKFYKLAMKRREEINRLRLIDNKYYYTKEELNAINYFYGTGFYQKQQNSELEPNIFDTRQTFLFKMHDRVARNNYLKFSNGKASWS